MGSKLTGTLWQQLEKLGARDEASDQDLLRRFAADRDDEAFAILVRRHGPMVLGVCRRLLRQEQDAEDAFQAAFLVLARKAATVEWHESITGWLFGVASRVALKVRTEVRGKISAVADRAGPAPDPAEEVSLREAQCLLVEELAGLPEQLRAPLVLCHLEGLTRDEAACRLSLSLGTLKRRLEEGRGVLRARLARRGLGLSVALVTSFGATAVIPSSLLAATVRAAPAFVAGSSALCSRAGAVAEGFLRSAARSNTVVALALVVSLLAGSAALISSWMPKQQARDTHAAQATTVAPRDEKGAELPGPPGVIAVLGQIHQPQNFAAVWGSLACSPDGKTVAVCGQVDEGTRLFDAVTGRELRRLAGHRFLGFSPAASALTLRISGRTISVWDATGGKQVCQLQAIALHPDAGRMPWLPCALSLDCRTLALGQPAEEDDSYDLGLWDVTTGRRLHTLKVPSIGWGPFAFSPDGRTLAVGGGKDEETIRLFETATGKEVRVLQGHEGWITSLAFSPDGKLLASGGVLKWKEAEHTLRLWDVNSGKEVRRLSARSMGWTALAFAPDSRLAVLSDDVVKVFDPSSGNELIRFIPHDEIATIAFSPDGKTILGRTVEDRARVWDSVTGKQQRQFGGRIGQIRDIAMSPTGQALAAASEDGTVRVWDPRSGIELAQLAGHAGEVLAVGYSPDASHIATGGADGMVRVWDAATGRQVHTLKGHAEGVTLLAFALDGKAVLSGAEDLRLWDLATGRELRRLGTRSGGLRSVVFSPDGKVLSAVDPDRTIRLWQVADGRGLRRIVLPRIESADGNVAVAFSPDGRLLATGSRADTPFDVAVAPDGSRLPKQKGSFRLWEVATGRECLHFRGEAPDVLAVAFSPDGRTLAAGEPGLQVGLWDALTGTKLCQLKGQADRTGSQSHRGPFALTFSPDGRGVAASQGESPVVVWDVAAQTKQRQLPIRGRVSAPLENLWEELGQEDAAVAYRAVGVLTNTPEQAVAFLKKRLHPISTPDPAHVDRLVRDLGDDRFARRRAAREELERLGELAAPALRQVLIARPDLTVRRQAEELLSQAIGPVTEVDQRRALRTIQVLERLATVEARELLHRLAGGAPEAWLTREAQASLMRLRETARGGVEK